MKYNPAMMSVAPAAANKIDESVQGLLIDRMMNVLSERPAGRSAAVDLSVSRPAIESCFVARRRHMHNQRFLYWSSIMSGSCCGGSTKPVKFAITPAQDAAAEQPAPKSECCNDKHEKSEKHSCGC
jgi:hypothetical protein